MPSNTQPRPAGSKNASKTTNTKSTTSSRPAKDVNSKMQHTNSSYALLEQSDLKSPSPSPPPQPPHNAQQSTNGLPANTPSVAAPSVNRKKQKRREKQAARVAAEQAIPGEDRPRVPTTNNQYPDYAYGLAGRPAALNGYAHGASVYDDDPYEPVEGEDLYYTDEDGHLYEKSFGMPPNGFVPHPPIHQQSAGRKSKKKSKTKTGPSAQQGYDPPYEPDHFHPPPPPPPPDPILGNRSTRHLVKDRVWNTSTAKERENIKEFWLSLGEEDRRSLVKVEKEAVLKKMKEQQKHSCSCTVCGRKRTAIEEELEVLYDAYYEELEQYANHQQISLVDGTPIMPPAGLHQSMSRFAASRNPPPLNYQRAARGRIHEVQNGDEEADDEEEDYLGEQDDDGDFSEDPEEEPLAQQPEDFFNFGNSLTVQGGILTVADDLLKNDGKKFIEMMEQLAERRMQREEDAQYAAAAGLSHSAMPPHNHGPPLDEEPYDEDDDEESYISGDEEDYEEDEMETMTEEQRMEEGRRMFQIFAARMFEQRVLTAYREKVAAERQQLLIEEIEEESRLDTQREAKKAKEAQKKKDKKRLLKLRQDEEKAQREAKKAAEEAAARAEEEKKLEEQRRKKEEQRKRKEAEKKALEEERQRKEAEKQRRVQEAKELQAEQERKQREQKERERKRREEAKQKVREENEAKEKAITRKKEDAAEKREQEVRVKAEKESKEQSRRQEQAVKTSTPSSTVSSADLSNPKMIRPPTQTPAQTRSSHASPHLQIATPAVPKAPTPVRARQPSFQDSHASSPKTSQAPSTGSNTSPGLPGVSQNPGDVHVGKDAQIPPRQHHQTPPFHPASSHPAMITQPPGLPPMPAMGGHGYPANFGPMIGGPHQRASISDASYGHQPPLSSPQQRHFMPHGSIPFGPSMHNTRQIPPGMRGAPMDVPSGQGAPGQPPMGHPSYSTQYGVAHNTIPSKSPRHSRHASASIEPSVLDTPSMSSASQPIARPAPIQRPSSVTPHQQSDRDRTTRTQVDDITNHLGSSALLDDSDIPLALPGNNNPRRGSMALGGPLRPGFGASPMFPDSATASKMESNFQHGGQGGNGSGWGAPHMPFGTPSMAGSPQWNNTPGSGWPSNNAFGIIGSAKTSNMSRARTVRLLVCQACNKLTASQPSSHGNGFHPVESVMRQVDLMKPAGQGIVTLPEMLEICDTEGSNQNGGGSFLIESHGEAGTFIKFEPGRNTSMSNARGPPGDIGSPIIGSAFPGFGGGPRPFPPPPGSGF
ncbi:MAG: hypothetical protein Q9220_000203 [cf. Caloplaca sp. 1 TL-2023]